MSAGGIEYEPVIGLEIHVQLKTRTKMFCGCEVSFGDPPNTHTCPVCLGLPGALPVANERAVQFALRIGLALQSEISSRSIFHRKNYFYPDSPKGYQISQYDIPLCRGGRLGDVRIHRVHLEEDAAKLNHLGQSGRIHGADRSWVDFNRCGTPLVEIVTEPDITSPEQARDWLVVLRETLRQLGVSDVDMSQGSLRCDANVSVRPRGSHELGTKTELKNMNSFAFLERGVTGDRTAGRAPAAGDTVVQETLHFDPTSDRLTPLRSKEEAHDYRYFPEPDLVPLLATDEMRESAARELPPSCRPSARRGSSELGLSAERSWMLAFRPELGDYFERALTVAGSSGDPVVDRQLDRAADRADRLERGPGRLQGDAGEPGALAAMVKAKAVSRDAAREVLSSSSRSGGDPREIVEREGLGAISAEEDGLVESSIGRSPRTPRPPSRSALATCGRSGRSLDS